MRAPGVRQKCRRHFWAPAKPAGRSPERHGGRESLSPGGLVLLVFEIGAVAQNVNLYSDNKVVSD